MLDALISIKPKYVEMLISGKKNVEIRSRNIRLPSGSRLWVYSTLPVGCITAVAQVHAVERRAPLDAWDMHHSGIGVTKEKFEHYVNGSKVVSAIIVNRIWSLPCSLSLKSLKKEVVGFHPPQFVKFMNNGDPLLSFIQSSIRTCEKNGHPLEDGLLEFIEIKQPALSADKGNYKPLKDAT